jgi:hypothetical protein
MSTQKRPSGLSSSCRTVAYVLAVVLILGEPMRAAVAAGVTIRTDITTPSGHTTRAHSIGERVGKSPTAEVGDATQQTQPLETLPPPRLLNLDEPGNRLYAATQAQKESLRKFEDKAIADIVRLQDLTAGDS